METIAGIAYSKPTVVLLQETGIGTAEMAARTCYDSFDASENRTIKYLNDDLNEINYNGETIEYLDELNNIPHADLLDKLAWTHFHHSILEHANLSFLVRGTSRGVLQEHARHRIQAISVRSTRYTMSSIINAYVSSLCFMDGLHHFKSVVASLDMFVTSDKDYNDCEVRGIYLKLQHQLRVLGRTEFYKLAVTKSSLPLLDTIKNGQDLFMALESGKSKRNVGDSFKHIITDNFKVDMVVTMNLRALKNYLELRDSGAAYFQMQWLAQAIKAATPSKYLDLIVKGK